MKKGDCSQPQLAIPSWPPQGRTTFYWFLSKLHSKHTVKGEWTNFSFLTFSGGVLLSFVGGVFFVLHLQSEIARLERAVARIQLENLETARRKDRAPPINGRLRIQTSTVF
jgi:hypothetical protein